MNVQADLGQKATDTGRNVADLLREQREIQKYGKVLTRTERADLTFHGRILTDRERRQWQKIEDDKITARRAGSDCAKSGGKMSTNPHAGGEPLWWAWHEGYKSWKSAEASEKRAQK